MTQEEFKRYIEYPIDKLSTVKTMNSAEAGLLFWRKVEVSRAITRTTQLCLKYPNLAQAYLDSLPKLEIIE